MGGEMRIVVQKYGGSSVADLDRLLGVADRVARTAADGTGVVVVVSAMGNTTNELLALARRIAPDPDRRELDMLLSVGERISMALLALALRARGVPAVSLTGSQSGIITDDHHADAKVVEVRAERVRAHLDAGQVVIVAGFQGVSRGREVTTLGRGGSDTTAVVLAAALSADYCEICSDVDGVFSADPRVVAGAKQLPMLSLDAALAAARGGAKVLFEDAVRYARDHNVVLHASATFGPGAGTRLAPGATTALAIAVSSDDQLIVVDRGAIIEAVALGARLRRVVGGVAHLDVRNAHGALTSLGDRLRGRLATVTAAGSALGEDASALHDVLCALLAVRVDVMDVYASADAIVVAVSPMQLADATRAVHDALLDGR